MGLENIDNQAIGIAITGMVIVFIVLTIVSLFIALMPILLRAINHVFPPAVSHHHAPLASMEKPQEADDAAIAAIGFAIFLDQGDST